VAEAGLDAPSAATEHGHQQNRQADQDHDDPEDVVDEKRKHDPNQDYDY
jgi:hypothetical protein